MPGVPEAASTPAYIVLGIGLLFYAALAVCAGRTFLLTRRFADMAVVYGLVLLAVALVPGLLMRYYELGWWLGHAWELIGIGLVGVPWRSTCTAARSHARSWATCARASW